MIAHRMRHAGNRFVSSEQPEYSDFPQELAMPTVLRIGRYRFYFFSNEGEEPPHIHVKAAENECKFWLNPVELEVNYGFNSRELGEIQDHVKTNRELLLEAWHEHLGDE
jgi:hypothetical protein